MMTWPGIRTGRHWIITLFALLIASIMPGLADAQCDAEPSAMTYYEIGSNIRQLMDQRPDLDTTLAPLVDQSFASGATLWQALAPQLRVFADDCTIEAIRTELGRGQVFRLSPELANSLALAPEMQTVMPVLKEILGHSTPTPSVLYDTLNTQFHEAYLQELMAEVEDLAQIVADNRVDEGTDQNISAAIPTGEFLNALESTPFPPNASPEALKKFVRERLSPVASSVALNRTSHSMKQIENTIVSDWTLSDSLRAVIAEKTGLSALPAFSDMSDEELVAYRAIDGLIYPNQRLMQAAFDDLGDAIPRETAESLMRFAHVAGNNVPRDWSSFDPDCACAAARDENAIVYGFYPFWFAPDVLKDQDTIPQIDFSLFNRTAFYGVELRVKEMGNTGPELALENLDRWFEARDVFIHEAHQHRAKVDLAIDLYGWESWDAADIADAVRLISAQLGGYEQFLLWNTFTAPFGRAPNLFDAKRPDGVTLVFDLPSDGALLTDTRVADNFAALVHGVFEHLPDPLAQTVNVAFEFALLGDEPGASLPVSIRELLSAGRHKAFDGFQDPDDPLVASALRYDRPVVDEMLLFLPRPTETAKKELRRWVELSEFDALIIADILRSLIPVLPPSGHNGPVPPFERRAADPEIFAQFRDDIIFAQDNFSGVAFWPMPRPGEAEAAAINNLVRAKYLEQGGIAEPGFLAALRSFLNPRNVRAGMCKVVCPNRGFIYAITISAGTLIVLSAWFALFFGLVNRLAFDSGLFAGLNTLVALALLALWICDPYTLVPSRFLLAQFVLLLAYRCAFRDDRPDVADV